jgi:hypothetical protein
MDINKVDSSICMAQENELKRILKIIDSLISKRRKQINIAFEGKDERMMAHLHTFINKFESELNESLK